MECEVVPLGECGEAMEGETSQEGVRRGRFYGGQLPDKGSRELYLAEREIVANEH